MNNFHRVNLCLISVSLFLFSCGVKTNNTTLSTISNTSDRTIEQKSGISGKVNFENNKDNKFKIKDTFVSLSTNATVVLKYPPNHTTNANQIIKTVTADSEGYFYIPLENGFGKSGDILLVESYKRPAPNLPIITSQAYIKKSNLPSQTGVFSFDLMKGSNVDIWYSNLSDYSLLASYSSLFYTYYPAGIFGDRRLAYFIRVNSSTTASYILTKYIPNGLLPTEDPVDSYNISDVSKIQFIQKHTSKVFLLVEQALKNLEDPMSVIKYDAVKDVFYIEKSKEIGKILSDNNCKNCSLTDESFDGVNLSGTNLANSDLSEISMSNSFFNNVDFSNAIFKNNLLSSSEISNSNFTNTDISSTDLTGSVFSKNNFTNAKLPLKINSVTFLDSSFSTDFKGINFKNSTFQNINVLSNIDITFDKGQINNFNCLYDQRLSNFSSGFILSRSNINSLNVSNVETLFIASDNDTISSLNINNSKTNLRDWVTGINSLPHFSNDKIDNLNIMDSDIGFLISNSQISNSTFKNTRFYEYQGVSYTNPYTGYPTQITVRSNTNISSSILSNVVFDGADMTQIPFSNSEIKNSQIINSNLSGSVMNSLLVQDSIASNIDFSSSTMNNTKFLNCDLQGAKFINLVGLNNLEFNNSNLKTTDFTGTDMSKVILTGSDLTGAKWTDGRVCGADSIGECK